MASTKRIDLFVKLTSTVTKQGAIDYAYDKANSRDNNSNNIDANGHKIYAHYYDVTDFRDSSKYMVFGDDAQNMLQLDKSHELVPPQNNTDNSGSGKTTEQLLSLTFSKKIYSNNPMDGNYFGRAVAITDNMIVVGSHGNSDNGSTAGKVELFSIDGNYIKTMYSNTPTAGDCFGISIATYENYILIGSYGNNDKDSDAGKVELFSIDGNYIKTIYSNTPTASDRFGVSVAMNNLYIFVGSNNDDKGINTGKVEVFDIDGNYIKTICSNTVTDNDRFGSSIAVNDNYILAGSYANDDKGINAGKIEVFDIDGNYIKTMYSNDPVDDDRFGLSVGMTDKYIIVGSYLNDDKGSNTGKVELFDIDGNYLKTIYSNEPINDDRFGVSSAITNNYILIGSHANDDNGAGAGKIELFNIN